MKMKKSLFILISILSITGYGVFVFAAAPTGGYDPGATLNPDCNPGDTSPEPCIVKVASSWSLTGNAGTTPGTEFLGTTDAQNLMLKTNGNQIALFGQTGNVALGSADAGLSAPVSVASGSHSFAAGLATVASGDYSTALGIATTASAAGASAFGDSTVASGVQSTAFGQGTTASGIQSTSFGASTIASGNTSAAFGFFTTASGELSNAFGNNSIASGSTSNAFGYYSTASGDNSTAFGVYSLARSYVETVFGTYNTDYTPVGGATVTNSADRLFVIGNGTGAGSESDAFTILKNGKTGIGYNNFETTVFDSLLQVNGSILSAPLAGCSNQLTTDVNGKIICASTPDWSLTGNSGTTPGVNFLGTTDAQDFVIKTDGIEMARFYEDTGSSPNSISFGQGIALTSNMFVYGYQAGYNATSATSSNFFGYQAGYGAGRASNSNFFGYQAGYNAVNARNSNFFGLNAGYGARNANDATFLGSNAGFNATNAYGSTFVGADAGNGASSAQNSFFFGTNAGDGATGAYQSNLIGVNSGRNATDAFNSIFLGSNSGQNAATANNAIFIGVNAGQNDTVNNNTTPGVNTGYSILLGDNTSTGGYSYSIGIGSFAVNTASHQLMIGANAGPGSNFYIDSTIWNGSAGTSCTLTTGTGMACSSDERLKTNITDLTTDTLDNLLKVRTVTYNWLQNPGSPQQIGFLAQDLEQYFPQLVATNKSGFKSVYYSQITPVLVEAIREMNLNITDITNMSRPNTWRDALIAWFGNISNGITDFFAKRAHIEQLCVGTNGNETCLTKDQVDHIINATNTTTIVPPVIPVVTDPSITPTPDTPPPADTGSTPPPDTVTTPPPADTTGTTSAE